MPFDVSVTRSGYGNAVYSKSLIYAYVRAELHHIEVLERAGVCEWKYHLF